MTNRLIQGDVLAQLPLLAAESVHCVVTSPPYWGLRDYGVPGQLGLEGDYRAYIATMVAVFREVWRVLRSDGTLWLNLGDSYATGGTPSLKPKDLCGIPWRVAFALQEDGWWLRQDIVWAKPNPMPESVTDRCTKSHEYVFLLAKSERYYFDADAIAEPFADDRMGNPGAYRRDKACKDRRRDDRGFAAWNADSTQSARNKRSVWTIATQPFKEAHFATFPPALVEPCVLAGTSSQGCCAKCGAPLKRMTQPSERYAQALGKGWTDHDADLEQEQGYLPRGANRQKRWRDELGLTAKEMVTLGWDRSCACAAPTVPCTVLDPFGGAGTTGLVADRLGRDAILIELNPAYAAMASERITSDAPLFARVAAE